MKVVCINDQISINGKLYKAWFDIDDIREPWSSSNEVLICRDPLFDVIPGLTKYSIMTEEEMKEYFIPMRESNLSILLDGKLYK